MYIKIIGKYIRNRELRMLLCLLTICLVSSALFQSCDKVDGDLDNSNKTDAKLSLNMRSVPAEIMSNTAVYVFDQFANYHHKQLNLVQAGDIISTNMVANTWDLVLLSCNTDISDKILLPNYGQAMSTTPMWKTALKSGGEFLNQMPELRYASLIPVVIQPNIITEKSAVLNRNVAMVRVILKEHNGFDQVIGTHESAYAELLDVPTTLFWNGKLSTASADISSKPLREYFVFDATGKANVLEYIIPADIDADSFNPATAKKLRLKVSMPINNLPFHGNSPVEIPFVPKPNGIIEINLTFRGEPGTNLDVKITAKDWEPYINQTEEL